MQSDYCEIERILTGARLLSLYLTPVTGRGWLALLCLTAENAMTIELELEADTAAMFEYLRSPQNAGFPAAWGSTFGEALQALNARLSKISDEELLPWAQKVLQTYGALSLLKKHPEENWIEDVVRSGLLPMIAPLSA